MSVGGAPSEVLAPPTEANALEEKAILIVEDHPLVADATRALLVKMDLTVRTAICGSAETALATFHDSSDWFRIFLDIGVPGAHGLSLVKQFANLGVANRSCVITAYDKPIWANEVRQMGMLGYIAKAIPVEQFSAALQDVLCGTRVFCEACPRQQGCAIRLTRRQKELLVLLHDGLSSKQIAARLSISEGTVNNHIGCLLRTLAVSNRTHAVARAIELGYIAIHDVE